MAGWGWEIVRIGVVPVPSRVMDGEAVAGEVTFTVSNADRAPDTVGVNVTLAAQDAPTAKGETQVVLRVKSPEFKPDRVMPLKASGAVPVLLTTICCAKLLVLIN